MYHKETIKGLSSAARFFLILHFYRGNRYSKKTLITVPLEGIFLICFLLTLSPQGIWCHKVSYTTIVRDNKIWGKGLCGPQTSTDILTIPNILTLFFNKKLLTFPPDILSSPIYYLFINNLIIHLMVQNGTNRKIH